MPLSTITCFSGSGCDVITREAVLTSSVFTSATPSVGSCADDVMLSSCKDGVTSLLAAGIAGVSLVIVRSLPVLRVEAAELRILLRRKAPPALPVLRFVMVELWLASDVLECDSARFAHKLLPTSDCCCCCACASSLSLALVL